MSVSEPKDMREVVLEGANQLAPLAWEESTVDCVSACGLGGVSDGRGGGVGWKSCEGCEGDTKNGFTFTLTEGVGEGAKGLCPRRLGGGRDAGGGDAGSFTTDEKN